MEGEGEGERVRVRVSVSVRVSWRVGGLEGERVRGCEGARV